MAHKPVLVSLSAIESEFEVFSKILVLVRTQSRHDRELWRGRTSRSANSEAVSQHGIANWSARWIEEVDRGKSRVYDRMFVV